MNRVVYYTNEGFVDPDGSYRIILAEENVAGYTPSKFSHPDLRGAKDLADQLNRELGYTEKDMMDVVSSSMAAQNRQTREPYVTWTVDVFPDEMPEDSDPTDPRQVAQEAYDRIMDHMMLPILEVHMPDGSVVEVDLDAH